MISKVDNFTKQVLDNLKPATTIFLAMARMEETQKPNVSAISSQLDAKVAAGIIEKPE